MSKGHHTPEKVIIILHTVVVKNTPVGWWEFRTKFTKNGFVCLVLFFVLLNLVLVYLPCLSESQKFSCGFCCFCFPQLGISIPPLSVCLSLDNLVRFVLFSFGFAWY